MRSRPIILTALSKKAEIASDMAAFEAGDRPGQW
jgi:hypothetical protein